MSADIHMTGALVHSWQQNPEQTNTHPAMQGTLHTGRTAGAGDMVNLRKRVSCVTLFMWPSGMGKSGPGSGMWGQWGKFVEPYTLVFFHAGK
jgi:hypothetical protein